MLKHWIWLAHRPGVSDRLKVQLIQHFQTPEAIFYAEPEAFDPIEGLTEEAKASLGEKVLDTAEQILADCDRRKLHILTLQDAAYPARLKNISDPPLVLYYKGRLPELDDRPAVGVVGTRKASAYGLQTAKRMGYQIAACGGIVVSGMAWGIDGLAIAGALSAGQPAVGVLGCGVDIVYPASNRALFRDVEQCGCLLSEFPPGTPPAKWTFPKRNRIISGLSCGVLVVEAPAKSGALITARLAADQGRDVFAVPGNIDLPTFEGSNRLLRDGAIMVSSGWEVVSEYEGLYPDKIRKWDGPARQSVYPDEVRKQAEPEALKVAQTAAVPSKKKELKKELEKKGIDKAATSPYSDFNAVLSGLSPEAQKLLLCLKEGDRLVDELLAETGMTTGKTLGLLTLLEMKGIVRRLPGRRIALAKRNNETEFY